MKTITNFKKGSRTARSPYIPTIKKLICSALILTGIQTTLHAQVTPTVQPAPFKKPALWIGVAGGANFNFYNGSTQKINDDLTIPVPFHGGNGIGLFLGPLIEYHRAGARWGFMLQGGYDSRKGAFKAVASPCNCPNDLSTKLSYITVEPSLRFMPFKGKFYMFVGPRFAFNLDKSFIYQLGTNPAYPEQALSPAVKGDLSDVNKNLISMQVGAGYDIPLSKENKQNQFVFSPFVSFQPYFGQSPRSIETWNVTTLRAGAALKFGHGRRTPPAVTPADSVPQVIAKKPANDVPPVVVAAAIVPEVNFSVNSPNNLPGERRVRETFPLRNYVFFEKGKTEIPSRYVLLNKDQVKNFKEEQLEVFAPKNLSGRSERQMVAYYNILNILGDRMQKKPTTTIRLVGSTEQGVVVGKTMAESVKKYLVDVFAIDASRISTSGSEKPEIPSEHKGATTELDLLQEGDRRVSIETVSPTLLMEFQSGPDAPLKPVELNTGKEAPLDSYVTFKVDGGKDAFTSWSAEVTDEKGKVQDFGPFTEETMSIPGKSILGDRPEGDYKIVMIGLTKDGKTVRKETSAHIVEWTPAKNEEEMRFSVIFDFDKSKTTGVYKKYLTEIVAPKIPKNGTVVVVRGYTDVIGDATHNLKLSQARANEVADILKAAIANSGRNDVKFEITGSGEDQKLAPFENKFPEERFYNRTVVIDIIPHK